MDNQDPQVLPQVTVALTINEAGSMALGYGDGSGGHHPIEPGRPKTDLAEEAPYQAIPRLGPSDEVGTVAFDDAPWIAPRLTLWVQSDIASSFAPIHPRWNQRLCWPKGG